VTIPTTRDWALKYASLGWRVFPVVVGGKRPLYRGWQRDATTDRHHIARYWRSEPAPNIGLMCGEAFVAFDIEADHLPALSAWVREHGHRLPDTPVARTGRRGIHILVAPFSEGGHALHLGGVRIGELKARGGSIVACPSRTQWRYEWLQSPVDRGVARAPDWLRSLAGERSRQPSARAESRLLTPSRAVALASGLFRIVAEAHEGERNDILFWASCRAAEHGLERSAATDILLTAARQAGLLEREARATIASGFAR
jgi:hypothetical protein